MLRPLLVLTLSAAAALCAPFAAAAEGTVVEIPVDGVVASVNGKPITLFELGRRISPPRTLTMEEAAAPEPRAMLDELILERLIMEEAAAKKISVGDAEIEEYLKTVAARNNMSPQELEQALQSQNLTLERYKGQVRMEILKSKIAGLLFRTGINVTDEEIQTYVDEHRELGQSGPQLKLRRITFNAESMSEREREQLLARLRDELAAGRPFEELAQQYSQGPEAAEGGLLGVVNEADLSSDIRNAVASLQAGQVSAPMQIGAEYQIFKVDDRRAGETADAQKIRESARRVLEQRKLEAKMTEYLTSELYKTYAVEKKV